VCWPLLCLCRRFCIFGRCLDSNPESCRSKQQARFRTKLDTRLLNLATHLSNLATHLLNLATHLPSLATHLLNLASHLPNLATHLPNLATQLSRKLEIDVYRYFTDILLFTKDLVRRPSGLKVVLLQRRLFFCMRTKFFYVKFANWEKRVFGGFFRLNFILTW
jgi:hypothetical protein